MTTTAAQTQNPILVGYDGTTGAERALIRAIDYARAFAAQLIVVSVAPPQPLAGAGTPGAFGLAPYYDYAPIGDAAVLNEQLWKQHREHVAGLLADAGLHHVEFEGVAGDPAQELIDIAEQRDAKLIIVGTRESGLLERLLTGSVSQQVARGAGCDVLIVHTGDEPPPP